MFVINMGSVSETVTASDFAKMFRNISLALNEIRATKGRNKPEDDSGTMNRNDSSNAWLYILFVLMFYAFSILVLLIKYIRREREGSKLEYYYNEFVKRDWYKDKNLYDNRGRRIHYKVDGTTVKRVQPRSSHVFDEDEAGEQSFSSFSSCSDDDEYEQRRKRMLKRKRQGKKSVMLCVGAAAILAESAAMSLAPISSNVPEEQVENEKVDEKSKYLNTGAVPKRSSLKNWPPKTKRPQLNTSSTLLERKQSIISGSDGPPSSNNGESRRESCMSDFDAVPLPFLQNGNKLMLAKVDERVHRVKSLPPKRNGRRGKKSLPRVFSDDSQDSIGVAIAARDED